jgi:hypothetical protein
MKRIFEMAMAVTVSGLVLTPLGLFVKSRFFK